MVSDFGRTATTLAVTFAEYYVLQMAEQLRAELQKCYILGFHPDAWPVRVTEFMEGDVYKAPAPAPGLTLLFETSS